MLIYSYKLTNEPIPSGELDELLLSVPATIREKVSRFRRWEDKANCLYGKLLLRAILVKYFHQSETCLEQLYTDTYGRPFISNEFDFNISHSSNLVLCAVSDRDKIGVDVEKLRPFDPSTIESFLLPEELNYLLRYPSPRNFYDLWTKKESILKAKGLGLNVDLKRVRIDRMTGTILDLHNERWHYQRLRIPQQYYGILCTSRILTGAEVQLKENLPLHPIPQLL